MSRKIGLSLFILSFLSISFFSNVSAKSMDVSKENLNKVHSYVSEQFETAEIVGGSYAVVLNDQVIDSNGIGFSDLKLEQHATSETIYAVASVTKVLTAAAILQLQEQGKLSIHDPVQKYLPWFTYKDKEKSKEVTIQHLLTHSAGVNRLDADGVIFTDEKKNRNSLEDSIRALNTVEMKYNPGEKGKYCNSCFNTLGLIIEKVSGESYYDYMKTNVFQPIGMGHTAFGLELKTLDSTNTAKEYSWFWGYRNTKLLNYQSFGKSQDPEGGIYTNSTDLARYVSSILGNGSSPILSQDSLIDSFTGIVPTEHQPWKYTIGGFEASKLWGQQVVYKGGDGIGSSAAIMMLPEEKLGVVLIIGESNSEPKQEIAKGMLQILMGEEPIKADYPPPLFKTAGMIMLIVTLISLILFLLVALSVYKRVIRKDLSVKNWLLRMVISFLLLIISVPIGYLLLNVRITQIGFYGYPIDIAIGLISLEFTIIIAFSYHAFLAIFGRIQEKKNNKFIIQSNLKDL